MNSVNFCSLYLSGKFFKCSADHFTESNCTYFEKRTSCCKYFKQDGICENKEANMDCLHWSIKMLWDYLAKEFDIELCCITKDEQSEEIASKMLSYMWRTDGR